MFRTLYAADFNLIANDSAVREKLGGVGELNLAALIENINNYCFLMTIKKVVILS